MATSDDPMLAEHEITQGALNHLQSAFENYRAADPQRDAYVVTSSTAVFDPLVVSTSVAWPIVLKALIGHFGTTDKSRREAVDPGRLGFARVMDVLRKTNEIAQDPMRSEAAEILLSRLQRAVMDRTAAFATAANSNGNAATRALANPTPASTPTALATAKRPAPRASATPLLPTPPSTSETDFASAFSVSHYAHGQSATLAPDCAPSLFNDFHHDTTMADGSAHNDNGVSSESFHRRASAPSTEPTPKRDLEDDEQYESFSEVPRMAHSLRDRKPRRAAASTASHAVASDADSDTGPRVTRRRAGKVARPNYREVVSSEEEDAEEEEETGEEEEDDTDDDDLYADPSTSSRKRSRVRTRTQIDLTSAGSSSEDEEAELTELALPKRSVMGSHQPDKRKQPEDGEKAPDVPTSKKPRTDTATASTAVQEAGMGFDPSRVWSSSLRPFSGTPPSSSTGTAAAIQPPRQSSQSAPPVAFNLFSIMSAAPAPSATAAKSTSAATTSSSTSKQASTASTSTLACTSPLATSATTTPATQQASDASAAQLGPSQGAALAVQAGPLPGAATASTTAVATAAVAPAAGQARPTISQSTAIGRRIATLFPMIQLPELASALDAAFTPSACSFARPHLGGGQQGAINMGTHGERVYNPKTGKYDHSGPTIYDSACDHLTIQDDSNVCLPRTDAFGEPIVLISDEAKLVTYKDALSATRASVKKGAPKSRRGSHVFVSNRNSQWVYRGIYDVAYDGTHSEAWQLPYGPGASSRIDPYLRGLIESRLRLKAPGKNYPQLCAWGWRFPSIPHGHNPRKDPKIKVTASQIWQELDSGKIKPKIPFLVLKCVGFDQADFDVWNAARG